MMTVAHAGSRTPPSRRVAFLRGINVGRGNQVSMPALVQLADGLGWQKLATYLRSGNLLFAAEGDAAELAASLNAALSAELGLDIGIVIRDARQLRALIDAYPFQQIDPARAVIACADRSLDASVAERLARLVAADEHVQIVGPDVFAAFPAGQASSRLAAGLVKAASPAVLTARNLNTMRRVLELLEQG